MKHEFCDHCPGCRPAMFNMKTGQVLQESDPLMININRIWNQETTYAERKAFIEVTVNNSRSTEDLLLAQGVMLKFERASYGKSKQ
jgi:hypothetical protein